MLDSFDCQSASSLFLALSCRLHKAGSSLWPRKFPQRGAGHSGAPCPEPVLQQFPTGPHSISIRNVQGTLYSFTRTSAVWREWPQNIHRTTLGLCILFLPRFCTDILIDTLPTGPQVLTFSQASLSLLFLGLRAICSGRLSPFHAHISTFHKEAISRPSYLPSLTMSTAVQILLFEYLHFSQFH